MKGPSRSVRTRNPSEDVITQEQEHEQREINRIEEGDYHFIEM